MKLTKSIREAFVRAAMADVPQEDFKEQIRAVASKGAVENLPPKVRAVWNDPKTRPYIRTSYFRFGTGSAEVSVANIPTNNECSWHAPKDVLSLGDEAKLAELSRKHNAQHEVLEALRSKLVGAANSVSTRKALADLLPEFERYLPADEAAANRHLPVVTNLVADFAKAGWPKGEKKGKRAAAVTAA